MNLTRNENTDYLWKTLENSIDKAEALLTKNSTSMLSDDVLPVSEPSDIEAFKTKVIDWRGETAYHLQCMFKDQEIAETTCPPIQDIDSMDEQAVGQLKAWLTESLESLKSLTLKARQAA